MCVSCCEQEGSRDGDKFSDTDKSLGVSLNRQGQVQPRSLASRFGKASSQPCIGREDSRQCRSKPHQPRAQVLTLLRLLSWPRPTSEPAEEGKIVKHSPKKLCPELSL